MLKKLTICSLIFSSLSACSYLSKVPGTGMVIGEDGYFRDRKGDYLESQSIPRTKIPEGMDNYIIDDLLIIPEVNNNNSAQLLEVPRPRSIRGNPERGIVIQKMEEDSWIVVDASASQVWPRVRDYWASSSVGLAFENPTAGTLETEWFVMDGNVLTREKFRVTIEPGFQDNSSEITLLHLGMPQATPIGLTAERWSEDSSDPDVEYQVLLSLSTFLADVSDLYQASSVSFLAGSISREGRANLTTNSSGQSVLKLEADYDRSWAAVRQALTKAGVDVVSQDRETGVYEVNYRIPVEDPSVFGKLFSLNGMLNSDETYSIQLKLIEEGSSINVMIENAETNDSEGLKEAQESLLSVIRQFIA